MRHIFAIACLLVLVTCAVNEAKSSPCDKLIGSGHITLMDRYKYKTVLHGMTFWVVVKVTETEVMECRVLPQLYYLCDDLPCQVSLTRSGITQ